MKLLSKLFYEAAGCFCTVASAIAARLARCAHSQCILVEHAYCGVPVASLETGYSAYFGLALELRGEFSHPSATWDHNMG